VQILEQLRNKRSLLQLNLAYNSMPNSAKVVQNFIECLKSLVTLRGGKINHLDLTCMALGGENIYKLASAFADSPTLCAVHLSQNGIDDLARQTVLSVFNIPRSNTLALEMQPDMTEVN